MEATQRQATNQNKSAKATNRGGRIQLSICSLVEESAGHLFFHCSKIIQLWWESLSWVNLVGVFPLHPRQHFLQHIHGVTRGMRANRWKWWWLALTWTTWKHRNDIIFANGTFNANKLMDDAVFLLGSWLINLEKDFNTHYNHWSTNLSAGFLNIPWYVSYFCIHTLSMVRIRSIKKPIWSVKCILSSTSGTH